MGGHHPQPRGSQSWFSICFGGTNMKLGGAGLKYDPPYGGSS